MAQTSRVRVWDWPVRIVHWLIALAVAALWWTGEHDQLDWHERIGYVVLGLVVFRILWGFMGGSTARFSRFVKGPRTVLAYAGRLARGQSETMAGHNPMGGWSVLALIGLTLAEVALGLFAVDVDGLSPGSLSRFVDFDTGRAAAHWHALAFYVLLALIGLHLAAVAFYGLVKRENLIGPMFSGRRKAANLAEVLVAAPFWRLLAAAALAAGAAVWIARGLR